MAARGRRRRSPPTYGRRFGSDREITLEPLERRHLLSGAPAILNPSFETPSQGAGNNAYTYNPSGAGWTFNSGSGIEANGSAWNALAAADGGQTAFVQNTGQFSQTLNFTAAGTYVLQFQSAQRPGNSQTLALDLDGAQLNTYTPSSSSSWTTYITTLSITTAGNHTIAFQGLNGSGDNSVFIDNVQLYQEKPPTVATPAAATPNPVAGTLAGLSVLGSDLSGESNLTYTWAAIGSPPGTVAFTANGTNAAKNTNATFSTTGTYTLQVTITNAVGMSTTSSVTETVNPLPAGWSDADIGSPAAQGGASLSGGAWTVAGSGSDIWNTSDQFNFASQNVSGNEVLIARVTSLTATAAYAKAGVMLRNSADPASVYADMIVTPSNVISFQWRSTAGAVPNQVVVSGISAPQWVELERVGNNFLAYYSADGVTWTQVGASQSIAMNANVLGGLAVTAQNNGPLCTATFTNVSIAPLAAPTIVDAASAASNPIFGAGTTLSASASDQSGANNLVYTWSVVGTPPGSVNFSTNGSNAAASTFATFSAIGTYSLKVTITNPAGLSTTSTMNETVDPLPSAWSDNDIGSPGVAGTASFGNGTWTVQGGGADIWTSSDQFNFASQSVSGNQILVAQVTGVTNTDPWSKAGVMFRDSTAANSDFVDIVVTPGEGVSMQWRGSDGNPNYTQTTGFVAPEWVKLERYGNTFDGYFSSDGVHWTLEGSISLALNSSGLAGLAVTAHNNGLLSTGTFTNVSIAPNAAPVLTAPAAAVLNFATADTANLSVAATDDGVLGELTYNWTVVGTPPAPVNFSVNGTNTSQNTVATFTQPGNYHFRVTITDAGGLSTTSDIVVGTPPTGVSPVWSAGNVNLSWLPVSGAQTYNVYRATTPGGEGATPIAAGITGTSYLDNSVSAGTQYYYQVTAVSSGVESLRSFEAMSISGATTPIISEFEAVNSTTLADQAGDHPDWIEIFNRAALSVNLAGYYLTDSLNKLTEWQIPSGVTLAANGYLVVFADGENITNPSELHTNFSLSGGGEDAALVAPDGVTVLSSYTFPQQEADIAYGMAMAQTTDSHGNVITSYGAVGYLAPTPGAINGALLAQGIAAQPVFDHTDGFYSTAFSLAIGTATPGAQIYYTLDGTAPSATNGTLYTTPLTVSGETNVRAIALAPNYLPSSIAASSYIYVAQVIDQEPNGQVPAGWPSSWGGSATHYGMSPTVVDNPLYSSEIEQDLLNMPTFSITMSLNDLFNPSTGIYSNPTGDGIAPASIEYIPAGGGVGFDANVGLAIHGGADVLSSNDPKRGFRVEFSSSYGQSELDYPLFGPDAAQTFDEFDLRTDQNNSWQYPGQYPQYYTAIEDAFSSQTLAALGQPAEHTFIAALYINGQFWGLYDPIERPNQDFAASYLGGSASNYDVLKSGGYENGWNLEAANGNFDAWTQLYNEINAINGSTTPAQANAIYQQVQGNNPDGTRNPAYPVLLDMDNLIQYQMLIYYTGNLDAPNSNFLSNENPNNFYAIRSEVGDTGFEFVATDSEWTLIDPTTNRVNSEASTPSLTIATPQWFFQQLERSPQFVQNVADHVQSDFFNGGPLSVQATTARFESLAAEAYGPVVTESARWGDYQSAGYTYTRDVDWQNRINYDETQYLPVRSGTVVGQLASAGLFPSVSAPAFSQFGGNVAAGFQLTITNPNSSGSIYYTLDGTEPLNTDGTVSSTAILYTGPITLTQSIEVKAQVLQGGVGSAATDATFQVPVDLRVTELNYDPAAPGAGLTDTDSEDYEFIELQNFGTQPLNLQNFAFTAGITYTFGNVTLAPGQVGVLVHNQAAFTSGYYGNLSSIDILGSYEASGTSFSNSGEEVTLVDPVGNVIEDFTYSPTWFPSTKGKGSTLEVVDPASNPNLSLAASWQASPEVNGTPGVDDSYPTAAPTGLSATPGAGQVTLNWTPVYGAASYNVYRGTTAGGESATPIVTGLATPTFVSQGLTGGQKYFYYVTAVDPGGQSIASSEVQATPTSPVIVTLPGFTPGDIIVIQAGNGTSPLADSSTAVFLNEYTPSGVLVQSIALPTAPNGANNPLTLDGTSANEGELNLSTNGQYLLLTGYDTGPGLAVPENSTSATVPRTVAEINAAGAIDTTTALTDFASGNDPRGAFSTDGTNIWLAGADSTSGGLRYINGLGGTTSTNLSGTALKNARDVEIFNGQLYISQVNVTSGGAAIVEQVGTGTPTSGTPTITPLAGSPSTLLTPGSNSKTGGFFFANLGSGHSFNGYDTLYVADGATKATGATAGITKYSYNGAAWIASGTIGSPSTLYEGLTGTVSGTTVTLYATGAAGLVSLTDSSGPGGTLSATPVAFAAPTNTAFRGVALAPDDGVGAIGGLGASTPYIVGKAAAVVGPAATFSDASNFMGGSLKVNISGGGAAADALGLLAGNNITFTGTTSGNILYGGNLIGTYVLSTGAASTLTVTFNPVGPETAGNTSANPVSSAAIQSLIQQITFSTTGAVGNRTVSFQVTENGGASDTAVTQTVSVESPFQVMSLTPNSTGFVIVLNAAPNLSMLNLYSGFASALGTPDMTVLNGTTAVQGSLVWDPTTLTATFIQTRGVLAPGTYTVTLASRSDGWVDTLGNLLDAGSDYTNTFTVAAPTAPILTLPDFARGPGQSVDVSDASATYGTAATSSLPVALSSTTGVTSVSFELDYIASYLSVSSVQLAAGISGTLSVTNTAPGVLLVSITGFSSTATAGAIGGTNIVDITASVPTAAISAYGASALLKIVNPLINGAAIATSEALEKVVYFGDANADGKLSAADATLVARNKVRLDSGFSAYALTDPRVIGNVTGTGSLASADASLIAQAAVHLPVSKIPTVPSHTAITLAGVDPTVGIPTSIAAFAGQTVNVPISITDNANGVASADFEFDYDPSVLTLTNAGITLSSALSGAGWSLTVNASGAGSTPGVAFVTLFATGGLPTGTPQLLNLAFTVVSSAPSGSTPITINPASSDLNDASGDALPLSINNGSVAVTGLQTTPTVVITPVTPNPGNTAVGSMTITFSEPVSGFSLSNLQLSQNGGSNLLTAAQTLTSSDGITWTLGNLAGLTAASGTYNLTLSPTGNQDALGHALAAGVSSNFTLHVWENISNRFDVNNSGDVSPLDALVIINYLNLHGASVLPSTFTGPDYLDANGDDDVSALDALNVINYINSLLAPPAGPTVISAAAPAVATALESAHSAIEDRAPSPPDAAITWAVSASSPGCQASASTSSIAIGAMATAPQAATMAPANWGLNQAAVDSYFAAGNRRKADSTVEAGAADTVLSDLADWQF